jgi:hypothetical protein
MVMQLSNDSIIAPAEVGNRPSKEVAKRVAEKAAVNLVNGTKENRKYVVKFVNTTKETREAAMVAKRLDLGLNTRDCKYTETSTTTEPGDTRVIQGPATGEATVTISSLQTVEWSETVSAGISFEIFTAGATFETSESHTSTLQYAFPVPAGQTGFIVWTPFRQCTKGTLTGCSSSEGKACFPIKDGNGDLVGNYALQQRS